MDSQLTLVETIYAGWAEYQAALIEALAPLDDAQLTMRLAPELRDVRTIALHIIGARARWFHMLFGEGGELFQSLGRWDASDAPARSAHDLVRGLRDTWSGMQSAITRWTPDEWAMTWPGEDDDEPEIITRQWVIWHLIEHDLHHGGEISFVLGANGLEGVQR